MKLEFLICGSLNDSFLSQIAFFRKCLDFLGGDYQQARLVASLGDHQTNELPSEWAPYFDRIEVCFAHEPGAPNPYHEAQHERRFELIDDSADVSVLVDADVAILAPMDELIGQVMTTQAVAGVIAHYHFPWDAGSGDAVKDWSYFYRRLLGRSFTPEYSYTLKRPQTGAEAPFYINYGVFAGSPKQLRAFDTRERSLRPLVRAEVGDVWCYQVGLALTCSSLDLPTLALPMRYNFPNDPLADQLYPDDLEQIVFMHYLRTKLFSRSEIFASAEAFDAFLSMQLEGSNERFQAHVRAVTNGKYPFPRVSN
ncbi:hypothetical protein [Maricaulis parjimensis]|uniref:hypothetical protein n=1 Tax=Maricaulis parjimensis TaxID=144023 RepID=UPI0019394CBA|nr:hypothetical protein [Maricaulis parjimensis]